MKGLYFPPWLKLLIDLAEKDRWINGTSQKHMHPISFYIMANILENIGILKSKEDAKDKRVKEYSLTIDGFLIATHIKKLYNRVIDIG